MDEVQNQIGSYLTEIAAALYGMEVDRGWWADYEEVIALLPPELHSRVEIWFLSSKIALIHSEISEMLEGLRKGLPDDHLPHRSAEECEGADSLIRLLNYIGRRGHDPSATMTEKLAYNAVRPDHQRKAREAEGGKAI